MMSHALHRFRLTLLLLVLALIWAPAAVAQVHAPGTPPSFTAAISATAPSVVVTEAQVEAARTSTPAPKADADGFAPIPAFQHGVSVPVDLRPETAGAWTPLPDGGRLWRLRITSPSATALNLVFDAFWLPEGSELYLYNEDRTVVLGPFTHQNNKAHGEFATDQVPGATTILEYYEPPAVAPARLQIGTVVHGEETIYPAASKVNGTYTPTALPCSINSTCSEGDPWADEIDASVMVVNGSGKCSGVLLNNAREDGTPYLYTAHHCFTPAVGDTVNWVVRFDYESPTCENPEDTPTYHSASGAVIRAASSNGDYVLAELLEDVPAEYDIFLAGWSIDDDASASSVVLGHPKGDLKKITFDDDPLMTYPYSSMYWEARFDRGTIEASSSGSPLFNDAHQFVGHVRAARWMDANACSGDGGDDNNAAILFPKLSYTWDQGDPGQRVSDFLDPDGTGITSLGGHRASESPPPSDPPVELWINEVNADAANGEEFVEIVGTAGADFTDYAVEIHSCSAGASTLERTETISSSYTFVDESHGYGFFLMSGSSLSSSEIDIYFENPDNDVLPDGSGIILVKNPSGEEVFDYQYDATQDGTPVNCPTGRTTRSGGDTSGSGSMGFTVDYMPSDTDLGTNSIVTSPGVSNSDGGQNLPVELVAFTATADGRDAVLRWETASETNNAGFEVQRLDDAGWTALTFVDGHGTTETPQRYQQRVETLEAGSHRFRLKQIDFDGTFEYSPEVEVYIDLPDAFVVDPVYPNPFNPQATLRFGVQQTQHVQVHLYNTLGQRVDTLYDREMTAGQVVTLTIDGSHLPSGTYFVHAQGRSIRHTQSITLVR